MSVQVGDTIEVTEGYPYDYPEQGTQYVVDMIATASDGGFVRAVGVTRPETERGWVFYAGEFKVVDNVDSGLELG